MKKIILSLTLAIVAVINATAQVKVEVSETVELMAILSRTAGFEEYNLDVAGQYSKDTEEYFASYRQHPIIAYYQDLRAKYGIGFEKVMNMAIHLDIHNGNVIFLGEKSDLMVNWKDADINDFMKRLNKFYKDTHFHEFFEQHQPFYEEYTRNYEAGVMSSFHPEWFSRFYYGTEPTEPFHVIICFTYGRNNNGTWRNLPGKGRELFAIMGYFFDSSRGRPRYDASLLWHEANHPFVNPLLDNEENAKLMENVGQKLLSLSQTTMQQLNYNDWHIVINESIVRAAAIIYAQDAGIKPEVVKALMDMEVKNNGFPWMPQLVAALRDYAAHRTQYKTFADYYPEIVRCLAKYIEDN